MKTNSDKNRLRQFATLALAVSKRVLPNHGSKFAPKTYTQPQLLACLLLKEYLRLDYRTAQEMLELSDGLRSALELSRVPDHSTLWWFARHKLKPEVLQAALEETVHRFEHSLQRFSDGNDTDEGSQPKGDDGASRNECSTRVVALDSTGLFLTYSSRYFRWRAKHERGQRGWLKWALALWVEPQMLVAQLVRPGPSGDFSDLVALSRVGQFPAGLRSAFGRRRLRLRGQSSLLPRGARSREPDPSQSTPLEDGGSQGALPKGDVPGTWRSGRSCAPRAIPATLEGGDDYVGSQAQMG